MTPLKSSTELLTANQQTPQKILLTGTRGIGKSTVIRKTLELLGMQDPGGFITEADDKLVYMYPASRLTAARTVNNPYPNPQNEAGFPVGRRRQAGFTEAFETEGVRLLEDAERHNLIVLDEIGWMEKDAENFCSRIKELFLSPAPILAVLRQNCSTELADWLRSNPQIKITEVTGENRDKLPGIIAGELQQ